MPLLAVGLSSGCSRPEVGSDCCSKGNSAAGKPPGAAPAELAGDASPAFPTEPRPPNGFAGTEPGAARPFPRLRPDKPSECATPAPDAPEEAEDVEGAVPIEPRFRFKLMPKSAPMSGAPPELPIDATGDGVDAPASPLPPPRNGSDSDGKFGRLSRARKLLPPTTLPPVDALPLLEPRRSCDGARGSPRPRRNEDEEAGAAPPDVRDATEPAEGDEPGTLPPSRESTKGGKEPRFNESPPRFKGNDSEGRDNEGSGRGSCNGREPSPRPLW